MPVPSRPFPPFTESDISRFRKYVDKTPGHGPNGDCWIWTCTISDRGYGRLGVLTNGTLRHLQPHRIAYFLHYGEDPYPLLVCHTCDNKACCNPAHLFKGTHQDNMDDMRAKGRRAVGERHWNSKISDADVIKARELYLAGTPPLDIAEMFSVTDACIRQVIRRGFHPGSDGRKQLRLAANRNKRRERTTNKLTNEQAAYIKAAWPFQRGQLKIIAAKLGVRPKTLRRIAKGVYYRHVLPAPLPCSS